MRGVADETVSRDDSGEKMSRKRGAAGVVLTASHWEVI